MTNEELREYYESGSIQRSVQMQLLGWAESITQVLNGLSDSIRRVSELCISDSVIKSCPVGGVGEAQIKNVFDRVMANKLEWLTGVSEVEGEE